MKSVIIWLTVLFLAISVNGYAGIVNSDNVPVCGIDWNAFQNQFPSQSTINITLEIKKYPGEVEALYYSLIAQGWRWYPGNWAGVDGTQWSRKYAFVYYHGLNTETGLYEYSYYHTVYPQIYSTSPTYTCGPIEAKEPLITELINSDGIPVCGIDLPAFTNRFALLNTKSITLEIVKYPGNALALYNQLKAQGWQDNAGASWVGVNTTQWYPYSVLYKTEGRNPKTLINEYSYYYITYPRIFQSSPTYTCGPIEVKDPISAELINNDHIPVCGIDLPAFSNHFNLLGTKNVTLEIVKDSAGALALGNTLHSQGWSYHYDTSWTGVNKTQWVPYSVLLKNEGKNPLTLLYENSFYYIIYPNPTTNTCDTIDTDGDGIPDISDGCPNDHSKSECGVCGCGIPDTDSDIDGVADCVDNYPYIWNPNQEEVAQPDNNQGGGPDNNQGEGPGDESEPVTCSPINFSTGNKYKRQTDILLSGPGMPFGFSRFYNSQNQDQGILGFGWTSTFTDSITLSGSEITLLQSDGRHVKFVDDGQGKFISVADKIRIIAAEGDGYRLIEPEGLRMSFNAGGNLVSIQDINGNTQTITYTDGRISSVTDTFERYLTFHYDSAGRLSALATPVGQYTYAYDAFGNLARVDKPDTTFKTYIYDDPNDAHNLTGIINENNIRSMTTVYDSLDRVIQSESAGGFRRSYIEYVSDNVRNVTDSRGNTTTFQLAVSHGIGRIESSTGTGCSNCAASPGESYQLNDRLWVDSETDAEGTVTHYSYDSRGNMLTKTEAVGTLQERTTSYTWHPSLSKIATITRESVANPGQTTVTSFGYDVAGNLIKTIITGYEGASPVSRTIAYAYNEYGRVVTVDGPRTDVSDVTTFTYYPNDSTHRLNRGQLQKVTNAIGQDTLYADYNVWGKPRNVTDINSVATTFVFDTAGRVESSARDGKITTFDYDNVGRLLTITLPGQRTITYSYTAAGLLETITDNSGNYIRYTYDTEGNRTREEIHDAAGTLARYADFTFDAFNRLDQVIYPDSHFEDYAWDQNDNLMTTTDAAGKTISRDYDPLNRLKSVIQPGDVTTAYGYDNHDNLTTVTDAATHTTIFAFSDLGQTLSENSPDAGLTAYTYDEAGNLSSKTDANGITVYYTYDILNRLTNIAYPDTVQNVTYTYDAGTYGRGRLTGMIDQSGSYTYAYDADGNLITEERTIAGMIYTTSYAYDASGILTGMTYPGGRSVTYELDLAGRVSRVTTTKDGTTQTLAENINYLPFGPVSGLAYGNSTNQTRGFDLLYRPTHVSAGSVYSVDFTKDAVGNITAITNNLDAARDQTFGYEDLYRLTSATGVYGAIDYTYDNFGNRLSKTHNGLIESYTYIVGTNKLAATSQNK